MLTRTGHARTRTRTRINITAGGWWSIAWHDHGGEDNGTTNAGRVCSVWYSIRQAACYTSPIDGTAAATVWFLTSYHDVRYDECMTSSARFAHLAGNLAQLLFAPTDRWCVFCNDRIQSFVYMAAYDWRFAVSCRRRSSTQYRPIRLLCCDFYLYSGHCRL